MITFDTARRHIVLGSASATAAEVWSRWADWQASNPQWPLAFRLAGGDDLGGGLSIPPYFFLQNGWRVRPMEANHDLDFQGNLFVEGGGNPFVPTLGTYRVNVRSTVPVQAQGISTTGGSAVVDTAAIAAAVRLELAAELAKIDAFTTGSVVFPPGTTVNGGAFYDLVVAASQKPTAVENAAAVWSHTQ